MVQSPLEAKNYRMSFESGQTKPQLFQCSDGDDWVLKLMGNTFGSTALAADWVGSVLAAELHIAAPAAEIVWVSMEALETAPPEVQTWAKAGPAFATEFIAESSPAAGSGHITQCSNVGELGRTVVLDTWLDVLDRKKQSGWNLLVDQSSMSPRVVTIDFGLGLGAPLGLTVGSTLEEPVVMRCPSDLIPYIDWNDAEVAVEAMLALSRDHLQTIVGSVPPEWAVGGEREAAVVEYLFARREEVARQVRQEAAR